jgi:disulfide bond formation protein DsbB
MKGTFIILATIIMFILGIIWSTKKPIDSLIKIILVIMGVYGVLVGLEHYGYIIQLK